MSNIRLSNIIPEPIGNPSGIISLPGNLVVSTLSASSTADSLSPSAGSIITPGGIGITKSLSVGGSITFANASGTAFITQNTASGSDSKGIVISGSNNAIGPTRGASLELYGNQTNSGSGRIIVGTGGTFYIQTGAVDAVRFTTGGIATFPGTTDSTSSSTGSLVIANGGLAIGSTRDAVSATNGGALTLAGGLAVAKSLYVGGNLVTSSAFSSTAPITTTSIADSSGLGTGSLSTLGGASVSKTLYVGGVTYLGGAVNITGVVTVLSTLDSSVGFNGGATIAKGLTVGGALVTNSTVSLSGIFTNSNTSESTALGTGSAVFSGGASIALKLRVGSDIIGTGNLNVSGTSTFGLVVGTSTIDTTAVGLGGFVLSSGISVAQTARFGGNVFISGTTSLTGATTLTSAIASGVVQLTGTTISSSPATGTLVCSGGFGLSGAMYSSGIAIFSSTQDSTALGAGTIVLSNGGLSVAKAINAGTTLTVVGNSTFSTVTATNVTTSGLISSTLTTDSNDLISGAAVFAGGIAIAKNLNIGANLSIAGSTLMTGNVTYSASSALIINNTLDSSTLTNASAYTLGGFSISKTLRVGTNAVITGTATISGVFNSLNTTISSSSATGSMVLSGGLGVAGAINAAGTLGITGAVAFSSTLGVTGISTFSSIVDATAIGLGSIITLGGISVAKQVRVGTDLTVSGVSTIASLAASGVCTITNTTESASSADGALVIGGGLGVGKKAFFNSTLAVAGSSAFAGTVNFTNITDSGNSTNGAVVYSGGVGVTRNLNVGGGFSVGAASSFAGAIVNTVGNFSLNSVSLTDLSGILYARTPLPGFRLGSTDALKTTAYTNFIDVFSLGNLYSDVNYEALQITTTGLSTFSILTRNAGTGVARRLLLQAGATNTGQLTLNTDGSVAIGSTTVDSTSLSTGSLVLATGIAVPGSISIGKNFRIFGATSGAVSFNAPATVTSYNLVLPSTLPSASNYALVSDTSGVLSWSLMTTANPSFSTVTVTGSGITNAGNLTFTADQTGVNFFGGGSIYKKNGGGMYVVPHTDTHGYTFTNNAQNVTWLSLTSSGINAGLPIIVNDSTPSTSVGSGSLRTAGGLSVSGASYFNGNLNLAGPAGANMVISNVNGVAAPTYTTRSVGTKFIVYPGISTTFVDYAIGVEGNHMWFSTGATTDGFKWYSGTNNTMTLRNSGSAGLLSLNSGVRMQFSGSTSGTVILQPPSTITSYTLTLPSTLPSTSNYALVSDTSGSLSWSQMTTANPSFTTVAITATTPSTGAGTGALIISGGASIASGLFVGGSLMLTGATVGTVVIKVPDTNSSPTYTLPGTLPSTGQVLSSDSLGNMKWTDMSGSANYSVSGANNVLTPTAIAGMKFSGMFTTYVYVNVTNSGTPLSAMYILRGFPNSTGYELDEKFLGDDVGVDFSIDATGQITYTSTNMTGWTGSTIQWTGPEKYSKPTGGTPTSVAGANNVTTAADVSTLIMSGPQFSIFVLVRIINSTAANSTATLYQLDGVQQPSGAWSLSQKLTGPNAGVVFSILPSGQIQYTSGNTSGWLSTSFVFYAPTVALQNTATYDSITLNNGISAPNMIMYRNRVHNGDMQIDQRNNGASINPVTNQMTNHDRWRIDHSVSGLTSQRVPITNLSGFNFAWKLTNSGTASATNAQLTPLQLIEGYFVSDLQWGTPNAQPATISFYVQSSVIGSFGCSIVSVGTGAAYYSPYTVTSANTWQKVIINIPGCTIGVWNSTNNSALYLEFPINGTTIGSNTTLNTWYNGNPYFVHTGGTNWAATANATFFLTGVQFEKGSIATPYESRPYPVELQLCQRYYFRWVAWDVNAVVVGGCQIATSTVVYCFFTFPVAMRGLMTMNYSGPFAIYAAANYVVTGMTISTDSRSPTTCRFDATVSAGGLTIGQCAWLKSNNNTTSYIEFSADLA